VIAPWWWLALVPIAIVLMVVAATGLPARLATRIPTADALRYE
jgi:putative ABC transport system permease protein